MTDFATPPAFSFAGTPLISAAASSSSSSPAAPAVDEAFEDACSICLDPFTTQNPATVTSCKHEYHLQCILEWSQRSKECPICWQLFVLKDPASQELLAAVETEKRLRSRNTSPAEFTNIPHFYEGFNVDQDSCSDDSDFDERIMQHLAAAASRTRYIRRRERQRSSGLGPSQVLVFTSANLPSVEQTSADNSPNPGTPLVDNLPHLPPVAPSVANNVSSSTIDKDGPFKPRIVFRQPTSDTTIGPGSSETSSFSDSIKAKWFSASARYKESISKSTRGIKEKLLARNNSVKELSKGVQKEMSAGIAGVARMIERLDLTSKRPGASSPTPCTGGTNLSSKGKGVQEIILSHTPEQETEEIKQNTDFHVSGGTSPSPGRLEVSQVQVGQ